jgi:hypothetical protein
VKTEGGFVAWVIFAILLVVWLFSFVGGYTFGGLVHLLLVAALVVVIFNERLRAGRRPTASLRIHRSTFPGRLPDEHSMRRAPLKQGIASAQDRS